MHAASIKNCRIIPEQRFIEQVIGIAAFILVLHYFLDGVVITDID
ncbi:hypothetical protein [Nitrosomonas marina]|nr:hypothetical protein [Nitrosomonas marina]